MAIFRYFRYVSWPIVAAMIALLVIGVIAIEVSEDANPGATSFASKQAKFAVVAVIAFLVTSAVPYQRLGRWANILFALTLGLLLLVLVLPSTRGSHRWINLRVIQVQPSEIAKITYVIMLAWYLRYRSSYRQLSGLIPPFILTMLPIGLILLEPDLGTSLLFFPTLYFMLFMAGARLRHLLSVVALALVYAFLPVPRQIPTTMGPREAAARKDIAYFTLTCDQREYAVSAAPLSLMPYRQFSRIYGWLRQGDSAVIADEGFQLFYGKMILGSGMFTGGSGGDDTAAYFRILPDDHTDFIFSVIGGQWGFLGCSAVFFLYGVIFLFGIEIATMTRDPFGRLLAVGVLSMLFSQVVINAGMTMGLMPITGMTLPFISYGGSSLVINCAAMGLLVNVDQRRPILLGHAFEHDSEHREPSIPYSRLSGDWRHS